MLWYKSPKQSAKDKEIHSLRLQIDHLLSVLLMERTENEQTKEKCNRLQRYYDDIHEVLAHTRQQGNTTWLLKAALKNPDCIIVVGNQMQRQELLQRLSKLTEGKQVDLPEIMTLHQSFVGLNKPVIFDLASLT